MTNELEFKRCTSSYVVFDFWYFQVGFRLFQFIDFHGHRYGCSPFVPIAILKMCHLCQILFFKGIKRGPEVDGMFTTTVMQHIDKVSVKLF
jgi:hypothetical protein